MILDLPRFLARERPFWEELDRLLHDLDLNPYRSLTLAEVTRLRYLNERAVSGLGKIATFSAETSARDYLESLVARAYAECRTGRSSPAPFRPRHWLLATFPRTFRRHIAAFSLALGLTLFGVAFGAAAIRFDRNAKTVLMPFSALQQSPAERVHHEEASAGAGIASVRTRFSAQLMTHNIQVALTTFALGVTWGIGSTLLLFYNGVTLGAVAADYIGAGYGEFLSAWLLPHGIIEIPAILVAGQAGFVLAAALLNRQTGMRRGVRLRAVAPDILTLAGGAAVMLVWAGIVEAFLSQYHYPVLPYSLKILFGAVEGVALTLFLWRGGRTGA